MENSKLNHFDDQLKEISEKINNLKDDYDSIGSVIADLVDKQRMLLSEKGEYIVRDRIMGNDGAYAIAYTPKEISGCGNLLWLISISNVVPNKALSGVYGRSILYRYFDNDYKINIESTFISAATHEEYEKDSLIYRIPTEAEYNNLLIKLVKENMTLEQIHSYLHDNFKRQNI